MLASSKPASHRVPIYTHALSPIDVPAYGGRLLPMTEGPSVGEVLAELPDVAQRASEAVLDLYAAIRQAKVLGASYGQIATATGMPRSSAQDIIAGKLPRFAVGR